MSNYLYVRNGINVAGMLFPTSDGTSNQVIQTNGAGVLSWGTVTGSAANIGTSGVGVYDSTSVSTLDFRNINAASNKLSIVLNNTSHTIDIDVNPGNIAISALSGYGSMASQPTSSYYNTTTSDTRFVLATTVGAANGVCSLDSSAKVPLSLLPSSITSGLHYVGTWDASTNTPTLASSTAPAGGTGSYYVVSVAGSTTLDGISAWGMGDWVIWNQTLNVWERLSSGSDSDIVSVFGRTGAITATSGDYTASQITFTPITGNSATDVQTAIANLQSSKISSLLADTSPTLGANLDVKAYTITTSTTNGSIQLVPIGTGSVKLGTGTGTTLQLNVPTSFTILNNKPTPQTIFSFAGTTFNNAIVEWSLTRSTNWEYGTLRIYTDGSAIADMTNTGGSDGTGTGVVFSATVSGGSLLVQYTSTNTGSTGTLKYQVSLF